MPSSLEAATYRIVGFIAFMKFCKSVRRRRFLGEMVDEDEGMGGVGGDTHPVEEGHDGDGRRDP